MSDVGSWSVTLQETRNILGRLGFVAPNFWKKKPTRCPFLKKNEQGLSHFYEIDWFEVWSYWLIFKSNIQWLHFFFPCKNMKNQRNFLPSPFIPLTITKITSVLTLVEVPPSTYIDSGLKLGIWNSGCQSLVNPQNSRVQHNIMYGNCQN